MEIPVKTLIMESPMDTATPIDKPAPMALAEMAPEVISSTCFVRTNTAGNYLSQIIAGRHKPYIYSRQEQYQTNICIGQTDEYLDQSLLFHIP